MAGQAESVLVAQAESVLVAQAASALVAERVAQAALTDRSLMSSRNSSSSRAFGMGRRTRPLAPGMTNIVCCLETFF